MIMHCERKGAKIRSDISQKLNITLLLFIITELTTYKICVTVNVLMVKTTDAVLTN